VLCRIGAEERIMSSFFFFSLCTTLLLCILSNLKSVSSYPTGGGTCESGPAVLSPSSYHLPEDGKGTLLDGGYSTSFENGVYTLTATGSGNFFRGFVFRLSSNDTSAAGAFELRSLYSNVTQLMESTGEGLGSISAPATCDVDVAGVTHTENSDKTKVSVRMQLKGGMKYSLMVTVVKAEHEWYYSQEFYSISNTVASAPTVAPTQLVTVAPTSRSSNITVIAIAKDSPTSSPTGAINTTVTAPQSKTPTSTPATPKPKVSPNKSAPTTNEPSSALISPTAVPTTIAPSVVKALPTAAPSANAPNEVTTSVKTSQPSGTVNASSTTTTPTTSTPVTAAPFGAGNAVKSSTSTAPTIRQLTSIVAFPLLLVAWLI